MKNLIKSLKALSIATALLSSSANANVLDMVTDALNSTASATCSVVTAPFKATYALRSSTVQFAKKHPVATGIVIATAATLTCAYLNGAFEPNAITSLMDQCPVDELERFIAQTGSHGIKNSKPLIETYTLQSFYASNKESGYASRFIEGLKCPAPSYGSTPKCSTARLFSDTAQFVRGNISLDFFQNCVGKTCSIKSVKKTQIAAKVLSSVPAMVSSASQQMPQMIQTIVNGTLVSSVCDVIKCSVPYMISAVSTTLSM